MARRTRQPPENSATVRSRSAVLEAQSVHERRGARARAITVDRLERGVQFRERHGRVAPLGLLDGGHARAQLGVAVQHEFDRGPVARGDFLLDVGDLQAPPAARCRPGRRAELAADRGEQAGFARRRWRRSGRPCCRGRW